MEFNEFKRYEKQIILKKIGIAGQKKIETTALAEQENFPLKVLIKKHKGTKYEK